MTIEPETSYKPPPRDVSRLIDFRVHLVDDDNMLAVKAWEYRGKIVDFAVSQVVHIEGKWVDVARIDTAGGTIHRHQYDQGGSDLWDHRKIRDIPHENGWDVVDRGYEEALDMMENEWEDNLRRWRRD
jgi:hypothetical protein